MILPKINQKSFLEVDETDLTTLIENTDYRECEYLDYKQNFSFLESRDSSDREKKLAEFRSDVCAFANSDGGYLIYGISDENGCAKQIIGIDISDDNTDKFELDRRNNLAPIFPRVPTVKFHFVKLSNGKYVVIIHVKRDGYAPYMYLFSERDYRIYKRSGNGKKVMNYTELKNMFNQSLSLENEMYNYRINRINYFTSQQDTSEHHFSRFMLIHFIPETFLDSSYNQNIFVLNRLKGINFPSIFSTFRCQDMLIPNCDGIRCIPNTSYYKHRECSVRNNGVVECFIPLEGYVRFDSVKYPDGHLAWKALWENIEDVFYKYCDIFKRVESFGKTYMSISIIGCKDVNTENEEFNYYYIGKIDRNQVLCNPISIEDLIDGEQQELTLKKLYVDYLISIGIKYNKELTTYLKELYEN